MKIQTKILVSLGGAAVFASFLVFAFLYAVVYLLTAREYEKIVA